MEENLSGSPIFFALDLNERDQLGSMQISCGTPKF